MRFFLSLIPTLLLASQVSALAPPANVSAQAGHNVVVLSWTPSTGATSYDILRSQTNGTGYVEVVSDWGGTSFNDASAANGSTYYYVVTAKNPDGDSLPSAQVSATPVSTPAVMRLKFDGNAMDSSGNNRTGSPQFGSTWTDGRIDGAVSLNGATGCFVSLSNNLMSGLNNFTVSTWVKLNALNAWSRIFDFGTSTGNYMFLTPANGVNGKVRYAIKNTASSSEQVIEGAATSTSNGIPVGVWTHVAVTLSGSVGTLYVNGEPIGTNANMTLNPTSLVETYRNYIGKSQFSDPYLNGMVDEFQIYGRALLPAEVRFLASPPAVPQGVVDTPGNNQATLSWNSVDGVPFYNVYRAEYNGGEFLNVGKFVASAAYVDGVLANDHAYYHKVTSLKGLSESAYSTVVSVTPIAPPAAPFQISFTPGDGQVSLSWSSSYGATGYKVKRLQPNGSLYETIGSSAVTNFTDTTVVNGVTYSYVVSAFNAVGESADASPVVATPSKAITTEEIQTAKVAIAGSSVQAMVPASIPGHSYQVQYSNTLLSGSWINYGSPVRGDGSDLNLNVPVDPSISRRFYRILIQR